MKNTFIILFGLFIALSNNVTAQQSTQLSCLLEPSQKVSLSSSVSGVVAKVHAERGDSIKKGQVLFTLNDAVERAALETHKAKTNFAKRKLDRNQAMYEERMLSAFEHDELITEFEIAKLTMREAEERLKKRAIKSPINGLVVKREVAPGEYVSDRPVMELAAINPLHAEVVLRSVHYGVVKEGMKVNVVVQNQEAKTLPGKIRIVDRVIDGASGTFGVRVEIANPNNEIPAGLKCEVEFEEGLIATRESAF